MRTVKIDIEGEEREVPVRAWNRREDGGYDPDVGDALPDYDVEALVGGGYVAIPRRRG